MSNSCVLTSDTSDWDTSFSPPLYLDTNKNFEIALVGLETYNSIPNITSENNTFVYSADSGTTWKTIALPDGAYEITHINAAIPHQLEQNNDWRVAQKIHYISIQPNLSTLCTSINITDDKYQVDMNRSTMSSVFGFNKQILNRGFHNSEHPVNILSVSSILVHCDLVGGSYLNGRAEPIIYSFFPNAPPGCKIVESPYNLVYLPVSRTGEINQIHIRLTDQSGKLLNLRGETVTMRLHIQSIR
jgi:hypothetical protein